MNLAEDNLSETGFQTVTPGGAGTCLAACPSFGCSSKGFLCIPKYTQQHGKYNDGRRTVEDITWAVHLSKNVLPLVRCMDIKDL